MTADPTLAAVGASRVDITFGGRLENLGVVRTVVLAYAAGAGLDDDAAADLRLAVDEVCTALIVAAARDDRPVTVTFEQADGELTVEVCTAATESGDPLGDFTWQVLNSLADEVKSFRHSPVDGQPVTGVSLVARRSTA
jgi:serine/threonine-protein kinase RsbW